MSAPLAPDALLEALLADLESFLDACDWNDRRSEHDAGNLLERIRQILAVVARPSLGGWQPIETAPKDGREVLLRVKLRAGIPGKTLVGHFMGGGHCIEDHPPIDRGWYFWNGCMFDLAAEPIEWMPLPETTQPKET